MRRLLFILLVPFLFPVIVPAQVTPSDGTSRAFLPPTYDSAALASALVYPAEALEANIEGEVVAELLIATDGRIIDLCRIATHPLLNNAVDSVFSSFAVTRVASLTGAPSGSWLRLRFRFARDNEGVGSIAITDSSASRDQVDQMIEDDVIVVNNATLPSYDRAHLHSAAIYPPGNSSLGSMSTVEVVVLVSLNNRGRVIDTKVLEGNERFREAARRAVQATVFTPAILNGDLIPLQIIVPVTFTPPVRVEPHGDGSSHDAVSDTGRTSNTPMMPQAVPTPQPTPTPTPTPSYPPEALDAGIEGTVYVSVKLNAKGEIVDARIARGVSPLLDAEALRAVRKTNFSPAIQNGQPIPMRLTIPVRFTLEAEPATD